MTFGEMATLIQRLEQILNGSTDLKNKRLKNLATDIEDAYAEHGLFTDLAAYWLHESVIEELEVTK